MQNNNIPIDWETKKLKNLLCLLKDGTHGSHKDSEYGKFLLSAKDVVAGKVLYSDESRIISDKDFDAIHAKYKLQDKDIVLTIVGTVGRTALIRGYNNEYTFQRSVAILRTNEQILPDFLYNQIQSSTFQNELKKRQSISAQPGVYLEELANIPCVVPPLEEQEKIAQILATWDSAIEQLTDLIAEKQQQKKALMQRFVFSRSNTKSFKIHELFELGRGRVISKEEISKNSGIFPVYSSQTSNDGVLGYLNTYDFSGDYITWTTDGANAGRVFYRSGKFNCTNVCGIAKSKRKDIVNLYYVMCYLNYVTKYYVSYVGNPKLMNGVFSEIEIRLPPVSEQKAIADVLMVADTEIDLLQQKLQAIAEQKQGLMQQLLTGNIRVKIDKKS